ncbi:mycothiol synthase [Egibacter rhizosphaerae]|uniref:Mycothiol acetyltransferase n=1 Tax=Egibacter rhizosphaerae TaxID=1670831 RepID=A0A411YG88_9ACTN|nr:mycothiol synthase [Egibacter rhizosphaerae]QBI20238.1 mycothiol synthase [Egibacter rhizosphaerae]
MARIELHTSLEQHVLDTIVELLEETTRLDGHQPVGEHKYAHLVVGATGWTGVLAYEGDRLVGYAHTRWNALGDYPRVAVEVVVHPQWRADGRVAQALLAETEGVLARAGGGVMFLWVHRVSDPRRTVAAELGYEVQRELAFMSRPLTERPEPRIPEGVEIRPHRPGHDDAELLRVNNAAFEGHPENGNWDHAELERRRALAWFDPEDLLMAWEGDQLLGFHWTKWHGHDADEVPAHEPVGEVYVLGVDPAVQGRGLGRTLLDVGLAHLHDRGCRIAVLYVDRQDEVAVRLYEARGFTVRYSEVCYQRNVPPAIDAPESELRRPAG